VRSDEGRVARALSRLVSAGDRERLARLRMSAAGGAPGAWDGVVQDLEARGVGREEAQRSRAYVVQWVRRAEDEGRIRPPEAMRDGQADAGAVAVERVIEEVAGDGASGVALPESPEATAENEEKIVSIAPPESHSPMLTIPVGMLVADDAVELSAATPTSNVKQKQRADPLTLAVAGIDDDRDDLYAATPRSEKAAPELRTTQSELDLVNSFSMPWNIVGHYGPDEFSTGGGLSTIEMEHEDEKEVLCIPPPSHHRLHSTSSVPLGVYDAPIPVISRPASTGILPVAQAVDKELAPPPLPPPPVPPKLPSPIELDNETPTTAVSAPDSAISNGRISPVGGDAGYDDARAPSPIEEVPETEPDLDLDQNATEILETWERKDWSKAAKLIQRQIEAVDNGLFVLVAGEPAQPDQRYLRLLLGVCYSFAGDFVAAAQQFRCVLERAHFEPPDQIVVAAARWAGDTYVVLTESVNAAMAWSAALQLSLKYFGGPTGDSAKIAEDLRLLNQWTNAVTILKTYLTKHNRIIDTSFRSASPDWKRTIVTDAIAHAYRVPSKNEPIRTPTRPTFRLTVGLLTRPLPDAYILSLETSPRIRLPCSHDPTFRSESAICLLSVLARPKMEVPAYIPALPLGRGRRALFFATDETKPRTVRRGGQREWLVKALRDCLNAYALEFKVVGATVLVRLSQTHPGSRLAFYRCFGIRFRRLAMRPACVGLKMTGALFATRDFGRVPAFGDEAEGEQPAPEEAPGEDVVREQLIERLRGFLDERASGFEVGTAQRLRQQAYAPQEEEQQFELPGSAPGFELPASTQLPAELEGRSMWRRRTRAKRGSVTEVFELPA
jgi:hypothetical protein